jgi:hypothetical protein
MVKRGAGSLSLNGRSMLASFNGRNANLNGQTKTLNGQNRKKTPDFCDSDFSAPSARSFKKCSLPSKHTRTLPPFLK